MLGVDVQSSVFSCLPFLPISHTCGDSHYVSCDLWADLSDFTR